MALSGSQTTSVGGLGPHVKYVGFIAKASSLAIDGFGSLGIIDSTGHGSSAIISNTGHGSEGDISDIGHGSLGIISVTGASGEGDI